MKNLKAILFGMLIILILGIVLFKTYKYWPTSSQDRLIAPMRDESTSINNNIPIENAPTVTHIKVFKAKRYMELLHHEQVIRRYPIRLGFNPVGAKDKEGDGKTPEGIYNIDWRNANSSFYKSLHISYPNAQDKSHAQKNGLSAGGDVMIHGSAPRLGEENQPLYHYMPRKDWTLGCIAVSNAVMDEIWKMVNNGTSIEIAP